MSVASLNPKIGERLHTLHFLLVGDPMETQGKHKLTQEDLVVLLQEKADELGRVPTKKEMPTEIIGAIHGEFGKWIYALEAAGLRTPSETTLLRRKHSKAKWKKLHRHGSKEDMKK